MHTENLTPRHPSPLTAQGGVIGRADQAVLSTEVQCITPDRVLLNSNHSTNLSNNHGLIDSTPGNCHALSYGAPISQLPSDTQDNGSDFSYASTYHGPTRSEYQRSHTDTNSTGYSSLLSVRSNALHEKKRKLGLHANENDQPAKKRQTLNDELSAELNKKIQANEDLSNENERLQKTCDGQSAQINAFHESSTYLHSRIKTLSDGNRNNNEDAQRLSKENDELQKKMDRAYLTNGKLLEEREQTSTQLTESQAENQTLHAKVQALEQKLRNTCDELDLQKSATNDVTLERDQYRNQNALLLQANSGLYTALHQNQNLHEQMALHVNEFVEQTRSNIDFTNVELTNPQ